MILLCLSYVRTYVIAIVCGKVFKLVDGFLVNASTLAIIASLLVYLHQCFLVIYINSYLPGKFNLT